MISVVDVSVDSMIRVMVFLKWPAPNEVKTRLADETGVCKASDYYRDMVEFVRARLRSIEGLDVCWYYDPPDQRDALEHWIEPLPGETMLPQCAGDLARRQIYAVAWGLDSAETVCLIGTDCLELVESDFRETDEALDNGCDVVFGPATDGGYYLCGCRREVGPLFKDVEWSCPKTLEHCLANARKLDWKTHLLPLRSDIDTLCDLKRAQDLGLLKLR